MVKYSHINFNESAHCRYEHFVKTNPNTILSESQQKRQLCMLNKLLKPIKYTLDTELSELKRYRVTSQRHFTATLLAVHKSWAIS